MQEAEGVGPFVGNGCVARIDRLRFSEFDQRLGPTALAAAKRSDIARDVGIVWQQTRGQIKFGESALIVGINPVKAESAGNVAFAQISLQSQGFFCFRSSLQLARLGRLEDVIDFGQRLRKLRVGEGKLRIERNCSLVQLFRQLPILQQRTGTVLGTARL